MTENSGRIVVGIDGSPASKAALEWALDEARLRGATLEIVHAWQYPVMAMSPFGAAPVPVISAEDLEQAAEGVARDTVAEVVGNQDVVQVRTAVTSGHPAAVLLAASKGADLLVVGSRGHGGFTGMLLGSVSNHLVHHATCPVVIIRATT